jgi:indolepyruvate decarboxylase
LASPWLSFCWAAVRETTVAAAAAPNENAALASLDPYDALAPVMNSSNKGADLDYGPRGPQRRDNQLRPAT